MKSLAQAILVAVVFALAGAFAASLWLEIRRETPDTVPITLGIWEGRRIRVEVLNGAGVDGLAWHATERLRRQGFDVVYYGNARDFERDTSVAIARLGDLEASRRVADVLGVRNVIDRRDENLYLDVTVILGKDWVEPTELAVEQEDAENSTLSVWWGRISRAARRLWPR